MSYELSSDQPLVPAQAPRPRRFFGADHKGALRRRQWRRVVRRKEDVGSPDLTVVIALPRLDRGLTGQTSNPGRWLLDRPVKPGDDTTEVGSTLRLNHSSGMQHFISGRSRG